MTTGLRPVELGSLEQLAPIIGFGVKISPDQARPEENLRGPHCFKASELLLGALGKIGARASILQHNGRGIPVMTHRLVRVENLFIDPTYGQFLADDSNAPAWIRLGGLPTDYILSYSETSKITDEFTTVAAASRKACETRSGRRQITSDREIAERVDAAWSPEQYEELDYGHLIEHYIKQFEQTSALYNLTYASPIEPDSIY